MCGKRCVEGEVGRGECVEGEKGRVGCVDDEERRGTVCGG